MKWKSMKWHIQTILRIVKGMALIESSILKNLSSG